MSEENEGQEGDTTTFIILVALLIVIAGGYFYFAVGPSKGSGSDVASTSTEAQVEENVDGEEATTTTEPETEEAATSGESVLPDVQSEPPNPIENSYENPFE